MARGPGLRFLVLFAVVSNQLWHVAAINSDVCLPYIPSDQEKSFPNVPNSFHTEFMWNMLDSNRSMFVRELFSEDLNMGVMLVENLLGQAGVTTKLYTYGHTNEFLYIPDYAGKYGENCTVGKLKYNDFAFPFRVVKGQDHLVSGKDVILMGANSAIMNYMGTDVINDVDVDVFNGCLYVKDTKTTMNATYYFTLNSTDGNRWRTASGMTSVLKRIHIKQNNDANNKPAESVYEYIYFSDQLNINTPEKVKYLEPPLGSYCTGRVTDKVLPNVPDYFSFSMEVHDPKQRLLTYTDEWYDFTAQLSRMDHNVKQDRTNVSKPVKIVHDYETGLAYTIGKYTGDCTISAIYADSFDNEIIKGTEGKLRMRNAKEFFDFDNNPKYPWLYEGTHVIRGVECEVWISKRPYPTQDSDVMAYWEWYFTDSKWEISTGEVLENKEPFKMVISIPNVMMTEFNIYNFNEGPPDERYFDVSECFDQHKESRSLEFIMRADVDKYKLDQNLGSLRYWTVAAIERYGGVRALRVHDLQFQLDGNKVYVRFDLLGKANIQGDVENPLDELSLDEAQGYLYRYIQNGSFTIYYLYQSNKETQFLVEKNSLAKMEYISGTNQSVYYVITDDGNDYATQAPKYISPDVGSGGVAAIVIVLLIVGVVVVAAPFIVYRRRKSDLNSFNRSQLTMSDMHDTE